MNLETRLRGGGRGYEPDCSKLKRQKKAEAERSGLKKSRSSQGSHKLHENIDSQPLPPEKTQPTTIRRLTKPLKHLGRSKRKRREWLHLEDEATNEGLPHHPYLEEAPKLHTPSPTTSMPKNQEPRT
ncbi:unnamed protein product [Linum trigynum]|uniref:Uncharacterized protein n=1 Tax=Linum trigynum TaxID=586398 RepID=A0AAV2F8A3_9ROSI